MGRFMLEWMLIVTQLHRKMTVATIKISCDCKTESGWCNSFFFKDIGGCLGKCADCRMSTITAGAGVGLEASMGGFINLSIPVQLIGDNSHSIPAGNSAILQFQEVQTLIGNYLETLFPGGAIPQLIYNQLREEIEAPDGCLIGLVNIAGRAVPLPIPMATANIYCGLTASCDCNCPLLTSPTPWGTLYQCKDTCPGKCTLTIKDVMQYGQLEIKNIAQGFLY